MDVDPAEGEALARRRCKVIEVRQHPQIVDGLRRACPPLLPAFCA
jgi:hypothetical protein